jgi:hypothetical protein
MTEQAHISQPMLDPVIEVCEQAGLVFVAVTTNKDREAVVLATDSEGRDLELTFPEMWQRAAANQPALVTPTQRIENVFRCLAAKADRTSYPGQLDEIRAAVHQLADEWALYRRGELPALTTEEPF